MAKIDLSIASNAVSGVSSLVSKMFSEQPESEQPKTYTQEELDHAERLINADIKKMELAIERKKKEIEDLRPKNFFSKLTCDKDEIQNAENELAKLEDALIDLQTLRPIDYLRKQDKKNNESKKGEKSKALNTIVNVADIATDFIPGASVAKPLLKGVASVVKGVSKE